MEKKITKAEMFNAFKELVATSVDIDEETKTTYNEFLDKELASLEKRKESAQKRAAAKKEESDALTEEILRVVEGSMEDFLIVDDIVERLDNPEVTRNKVTARLGKLVTAGKVAKDVVKVGGARKMGYKAVEA